MKTVKYVPRLCKVGENGEEPKLEGSVTLRVPNYFEKMEYFERLNVKYTDDGSVDLGTMTDKIKSMTDLVRMSEKHYVAVELKNKVTGEEFKSFEDLSYDSEGHEVMTEVAALIPHGFKVGNA